MGLNEWGVIAALIAAIAGAGSAVIAALALGDIRKQIAAADRATEASLFVNINNDWKSVYPIYRQVLVEDPPLEDFKRYDNLDDFMNSPYWQRVRPIFAFYEFIGSCVEAGLLRKELVFKLVNVNTTLWAKYRPLIEAMRKLGNYPDLYLRWQSLSELRARTVV